MDYLEIELNYLELSYISEIDSVKAKEIFQDELKSEKIKRNEYIKVGLLVKYFGKIKSLDKRYDGQNKLLFFLMHKSEGYKKFLSHLPTIRKKTLVGGKSVLLKIMSEKQLEHFNKVIKMKYDRLPSQFKEKSEQTNS
ncbi:hypothetical protein EG240_05970 [Paenimyroides tangerinum]|uniref:Uncharacterized protein n=1 Tax=Paenimyroides tangerinum TaxID=2488728 RepID=A0A3P3W8R1_9FLAO|nr:hypothetical protein [Paenimyroides tangerinum]RRJ91551.1 hypothetical protein EG240_05970 [Paenimyroides tangerinum]